MATLAMAVNQHRTCFSRINHQHPGNVSFGTIRRSGWLAFLPANRVESGVHIYGTLLMGQFQPLRRCGKLDAALLILYIGDDIEFVQTVLCDAQFAFAQPVAALHAWPILSAAFGGWAWWVPFLRAHRSLGGCLEYCE